MMYIVNAACKEMSPKIPLCDAHSLSLPMRVVFRERRPPPSDHKHTTTLDDDNNTNNTNVVVVVLSERVGRTERVSLSLLLCVVKQKFWTKEKKREKKK